MEQLQAKHRQEQRGLQARVTQKKKSATKKTRKGINDECTRLESELKERQDLELSEISGQTISDTGPLDIDIPGNEAEPAQEKTKADGIEHRMPIPLMPSSQPEPEQTRKPNRQKARLARRAAEQEHMVDQAAKEAQDLPDLRQQESNAMRTHFASRGLNEHEVRSDGHCLYAAIADQLTAQNHGLGPKTPLGGMDGISESSIPSYKTTRSVTARYIQTHADDFLPFLEEPLDEYVGKIRDTGEWGGHLELLALAKAYDVNINVLQGNGQIESIEAGTDGEKPTMWLSYYRHSFGLGEHYNSLRQAG
ncbi:MAG: hypothetical protein Q9186_006706 [Xanthomendoza sp. 1 TL-2023]